MLLIDRTDGVPEEMLHKTNKIVRRWITLIIAASFATAVFVGLVLAIGIYFAR